MTDAEPVIQKRKWPLIVIIVAAAVLGPIVGIGWFFFVEFREPWEDMERVMDEVEIPAGFVFDSEERSGSTIFGDRPTLNRSFVAADETTFTGNSLCAAGELNGAELTFQDDTRCRMSTTAAPSFIERFGFWNGGYTVTFVTVDDPRRDYPVKITVSVAS